ncbi:MAG: guanosine monophosphate reductase [Candidatus Kerfeldbacteria bacterium RIFOXYA2_FULL_38_24]|uniref:Guanosine monophosphate reductase n=1 Tax=Candidatus Kerfeldbacteria bacterium RIFOXYB2_FULL_38_14 TaxID=1798547 RepID=A0A1G2BHG5_9BACT|nr:MAG: guanosine monophosphate reductase [Candidatus Kerfeldbacteria bacterium RIFOXYB2_FULL_38_14]OGY87846.1 MAG: guanosine monophosphate reductase [Candidatus Kerfeldbacteria bacterium RIFOXYA2_FULL_38_24]
MKNTNIPEALSYDDVLLIPQYSEILPADADLSVTLGHLKLTVPFLSAAMDTVTESAMAITLARAGALGVIHKNMSADQQAKEVALVVKEKLPTGAAISVGAEQFRRAKQLVKAGAQLLVVDSAHGHSKGVLDQVRLLKKTFKKYVTVVGGNVATALGAHALFTAGADVVKVGIGPGSICTTRIVAGIGVPQFTAVQECAKEAKKIKRQIIADGGIKYSGDVTKALAAGSAAVMIGSMFAGTDEAPGKIVLHHGQKMKIYRGMGSVEAMEKGSKDRYGQKEVHHKKKLVPEGVVGYTLYKGPVNTILFQLAGGVRAGMGYNGAKNIVSLQKNAQFVRITQSGLIESHPHDLADKKSTVNYQ